MIHPSSFAMKVGQRKSLGKGRRGGEVEGEGIEGERVEVEGIESEGVDGMLWLATCSWIGRHNYPIR